MMRLSIANKKANLKQAQNQAEALAGVNAYGLQELEREMARMRRDFD